MRYYPIPEDYSPLDKQTATVSVMNMIKTILARAKGLGWRVFYINFSMQLSFSGSPFSHLKNRKIHINLI